MIKVKICLNHLDGTSIVLEVEKEKLQDSSIIRRNSRFYTYSGFHNGKFKFSEVTQPIELD